MFIPHFIQPSVVWESAQTKTQGRCWSKASDVTNLKDYRGFELTETMMAQRQEYPFACWQYARRNTRTFQISLPGQDHTLTNTVFLFWLLIFGGTSLFIASCAWFHKNWRKALEIPGTGWLLRFRSPTQVIFAKINVSILLVPTLFIALDNCHSDIEVLGIPWIMKPIYTLVRQCRNMIKLPHHFSDVPHPTKLLGKYKVNQQGLTHQNKIEGERLSKPYKKVDEYLLSK